ncbi:phosphoribosyl-dephospho-CoA transferase [Actimicrobium sp. GrIS 1.19]|uniref:malonate decarboxylase holo-[acyl-carrier-protein] synthase n=1 Tax=Actimicrobium sp. GrIS 1.19 TaxID=3071708 RepID=UPI002E018B3C|nr:phosphoribosyl-dephospho-CoA transferase [Actimicrobium sp. GrIS 1.19]
MPPRHSLVRLSAAGWDVAHRQIPAAYHADVQRWAAADWPVIARRQEPDCPSDMCCLGLALPPHPVTYEKVRLPLRIPVNEITDARAPLILADVLDTVPAPWRAPLLALDAEAETAELALRVYGSAALQAITGLRYLHAQSDLDVLLSPVIPDQLDRGLALLMVASATLPLDGEIVFPSGDAVAWREWRNADAQQVPSRVLVKRRVGVALLTMSALRATLEGAACAG